MNIFRMHVSQPNVYRAVLLCLALLVAVPSQAQRPSIADLIAQINAQEDPAGSPAAQVRTTLDLLPIYQQAVARHYWATGEAPRDRQEAGLSWNAMD